ncbi:hypothetical protein ACLOJK_035280 [Asimina triloba]
MAGKEHVVIDVGEKPEFDHSWMHSMKSKIMESCELENFLDGPPIFIPRVGENVGSGIEDYYNPKLVSVGPYHHGDSQLQAMEGYKAKCLKDLLDRNPTPFEKCLEELRKKEAQARKCYKATVTVEHSVWELVGIMVVDAGFIIELFMKQSEGRHPSVFNSIYPLIKRDLLLLENQLPFSILQCMFDLTIAKSQMIPTLHEIAFGFFNHLEQRRRALPPPDCVHHLLHLYQSQFIPDTSFLNPGPISSIPSANKLHIMGVKFVPASNNSLLTDVEFKEEDVIMQIPRLFIDEETIALFTNLITFEQTHIGIGTHFTSYAVFISYILSDEVDVEFLAEKGIIERRLANHKEVAQLFGNMCSGVFVDPHFSTLSSVLRDVKHYSESLEAIRRKTIWEARMAEKPWYYFIYKDKVSIALTLVAGVGGVGVWIFTCLQTVYTILAYYHAS